MEENRTTLVRKDITDKRDKANMKQSKANIAILLTIPVVILICLLIKWLVRQNVEVNTSIQLCDLFWLNYTEHVCEYLDIQYGVEMIGRVLILVYLALALLLNMYSDKKFNHAMNILALAFAVEIIFINNLMRSAEMTVLITFIIEILMIDIVYCNDRAYRFLSKNNVRFLIALYIGGSLGNIIEMNTIGWVTDYLYFLPAYGFKATSNIEDWINWIVPMIIFVMISKEIIRWVKHFKVVKHVNKRKGA